MDTVSSGGLDVVIDEGRVRIVNEGRIPKFVERIGQTTFGAAYSRQCRQEVLYVTGHCVFRLEERGLTLVEWRPGSPLSETFSNASRSARWLAFYAQWI